MSRTPQTVLAGIFAIQPEGWAFPRDPASVWGRFMEPWAAQVSACEANFEAMLPEVDPRQAINLLPDYERVLGPDPCGRDSGALSFQQRQQLAYQRWTARGGQTPQFYIDLAASMGVPITITEGSCFRAGRSRCGDRLGVPADEFTWQVTLPATEIVLFRAGASRAGDRLGTFQPSLVQCVIARFAPAHTNVTFSYTG